MVLFAQAAIRVEHDCLRKSVYGYYVATKGDGKDVKKFCDSLDVKSPQDIQKAAAADRQRLLRDFANGFKGAING